MPTKHETRKLIEVALPLEAINAESGREKSIRHGHPSTLHLWWARRPLAACRAVLWSSLVDDPSSHPDRFPTEADQETERQRLFAILEELVKWKNIQDERVLHAARVEIARSLAWTNGDEPPMSPEAVRQYLVDKAPPVLDPFCGGGSIPLEAQRLGLRAFGSDLNPVAVLITKALIEIPPKFANQPPVRPHESRGAALEKSAWKGAAGLAEDVRYYGEWMREEAFKRIGRLYPTVTVTEEIAADRPDLKPYVGRELTVIAWLWARTVKCPNPACGAQMSLASSFDLSKKKNRRAWVEYDVDRSGGTPEIVFHVGQGTGSAPASPKVGRGAKFRCLACEQVAPEEHIKAEGTAGRMGAKLMAIVAEGDRQRVYFEPSRIHEQIADIKTPDSVPTEPLPHDPRAIWCTLYGLTSFDRLFTPRQLVALTTFSDLVGEARVRVLADAVAAGLPDDDIPLEAGGTGARAYADAVGVYLGFAVDRSADFWSTIATWSPQAKNELVVHSFGRQAIPMTWDYGEINPFSESGGNFYGNLLLVAKGLDKLVPIVAGSASQADATRSAQDSSVVLATDPPYYDNIGYADLSDFFYVWLRRSLGDVFPSLFSTMLVPKAEELIATPYRHDGDKSKAEAFFRSGLEAAFHRFHEITTPQIPMSVFYAFKQSERQELAEGGIATASTGWETMLHGLIDSGFEIRGTWPMRTERTQGLKSIANALASSIVLVCRPRAESAQMATRRDFINALKQELPDALRTLQKENIAPVDLAQAAIGPGMAIFSRYKKVLEADGSAMPVRTALALINEALDEYLTEQEGEFGPDTRWAVTWFEQYGHDAGKYGEAETLATARNVSIQGLVEAGILWAKGGQVRLLRRDEYPDDWDPSADDRLPVWELTQHLIRALENDGEPAAAAIVRTVGPSLSETARDVAYRLYQVCERKGWAQEAIGYNGLVVAWPEIRRLASDRSTRSKQFVMDA